MTWKPCSEHVWGAATWDGRFYCTKCGAKGYVPGKVLVGIRRSLDVVPYKCPKCHGPTCKQRVACPSCARESK